MLTQLVQVQKEMPITDAFPEPEVFEPLSGRHKHTLILLHGRGGRGLDSRAERFSEIRSIVHFHDHSTQVPLSTPPRRSRPELTSLKHALPDTRFVFPSACRRRATVYNRSIVRQWFDDWHLGSELSGVDAVDARYDDGLQTNGLGETVAYLHGVIAREAQLVTGGARNVVLGGFSQGAAAALVAALLWNGGDDGDKDDNAKDNNEPLGAVVGMSAFVPYARQLMSMVCQSGGEVDTAQPGAGVDEFDPFERSASPVRGGHHVMSGSRDVALDWLREEIEMPSDRSRRRAVAKECTPVLLCHGLNDVNVEPARSQEALNLLADLGMGPLVRKTYAGDGHEVSGDMLADVVGFLRHTPGRSRTVG